MQLIWAGSLDAGHGCEAGALMEMLLFFCGNVALLKRKRTHLNDSILMMAHTYKALL